MVWPFDGNADHNAGFATRSTTILRVEPLREGTTDIDALEAGWNYVEEGKILIYGAIDLYETIMVKLADLQAVLLSVEGSGYRFGSVRRLLSHHVTILENLLKRGQKQPSRKLPGAINEKSRWVCVRW